MSQRENYDFSQQQASIIVVSDRVLAGERKNKVTEPCEKRLREIGFERITSNVVAESYDAIKVLAQTALDQKSRLVLIFGGTGFREGNYSPEVARELVEIELPGIAEQMRAQGAKSTQLAPLSRQVVGVTARDRRGALLLASPGSASAVEETLDVLLPLLPAIFRQLDEA